MIQCPAFVALSLQTGILADLRDDAFPALIRGLVGRDEAPLNEGAGDATAYAFVAQGEVELACPAGCFRLRPGLYFALPGHGRLAGLSADAACLWVEQRGDAGLFQIGGPIEERGRLRYIDGCTDTLLIPPVIRGAPCLNLLHIPAGTAQSRHTHPSFRAGMIVSGRGLCVTPEGNQELRAGLPFVIRADGLHSFHTQDEELRVVAYHPDSDFGPTHEVHPMVNRTILSSTPA